MVLITSSPRGFCTASCACGWHLESFFGPRIASAADAHASTCLLAA